MFSFRYLLFVTTAFSAEPSVSREEAASSWTYLDLDGKVVAPPEVLVMNMSVRR